MLMHSSLCALQLPNLGVVVGTGDGIVVASASDVKVVVVAWRGFSPNKARNNVLFVTKLSMVYRLIQL